MADESRDCEGNFLDCLQERYCNCTRCENIVPHRNKIVFGEGPEDAMIFVVGEGPGETEDKEGRPFIGAAGQTLNNLLEHVGLSRDAMYISNSVMCRPTRISEKGKKQNRAPNKAELDNCRDRLLQQILYVDPAVILLLGGPAIKTLLGAKFTVEKTRGQVLDLNITTQKGLKVTYPFVATFHPSYLMQYGKQNDLHLAIQDLELLKRVTLQFSEILQGVE